MQRASCATLSHRLRAASVFGALGLGTMAVASLVLLSTPAPATAGSVAAWLTLALGLPERYLMFRMRVDESLFAALAARGEFNLPALDRSLASLGLRPADEQQRDVESRQQGTLRLMQRHIGCVALQCLASVFALAMAWQAHA